MSLLAVLLLALLWAASVFGGFFGSEEGREAQAQTPGNGSEEIAQNGSSQNGGPDTAGYNEEAYAAFGEEQNPFSPVLSQASDSGGDGGDGEGGSAGGDGDEEGSAGGDDSTGDGSGDDGGSAASQDTGTGGDDSDASRQTGDGNATENDTVAGPNGEQVDCSDTGSDFERIICEEERQAGGSDSGGGMQDPEDRGDQQERGGQQGDPGSGGSGRSGAGDPAEDFRNGGGGASK